MLDGVSLDYLRTFIAAADEGSFSAAGRRLHRAQSVVSQTIATLESQLGVLLFERAGRYPKPTEQGKALLIQARAVLAAMDAFKGRASSLARGLEAELAVVVDVMFPINILTEAVRAFKQNFPDTSLRLLVEALGAVIEPVLSRRCSFGVMGSLPDVPNSFTAERLLSVPMVTVAAPSHPLAASCTPIALADLRNHTQLVLTDRSDLTEGREFSVLSPHTWRLADLGSKHSFLRAGLGWGNMPLPMVMDDLESGALVRVRVRDTPNNLTIPMLATYPSEYPPGPAGRWLIDYLKSLCAQAPYNDG